MSDKPKYLDGAYPVELSRRLEEGRFLLRPSPELNIELAGILGHFARMYGIVLLAFAFASNHYHVLGLAPSQRAASQFARGVNWAITMLLKRWYGLDWSVTIWDGRGPGQVQILDDAAVEARFRYIISHGCKEHLVEHPHDWPGLTSAHQIQTGVSDRGAWVDRTAYGEALRAGKDVSVEDYTEYHELDCGSLPSFDGEGGVSLDWSGRSGPELLEEISLQYAEERAREGLGPVKGRYAVMAEDPFRTMPKKMSTLPLCIATDREKEKEYRAAYRSYCNSYHGAKGVLVRQKDSRPLNAIMEHFPPGCCIGTVGWRPMAA